MPQRLRSIRPTPSDLSTLIDPEARGPDTGGQIIWLLSQISAVLKFSRTRSDPA